MSSPRRARRSPSPGPTATRAGGRGGGPPRVMLRRSRNAVITIFGIMVLNFVIIRGMGDPALLLTPKDPKADQDLVEANKIRFGPDKPVFTCVKSIYPVTNISFDCAGDPFDHQFFISLP